MSKILTKPILSVEDLSYRYPKTTEFSLHDVSLQVSEGEYVAVMGSTGAGKTTLCLALNGIVPHFYGGEFFGSVRVGTMDTVDHPTHELARHVGMVFQDIDMQLTAPTVANEVAFPLENLCFPVEEINRRVPAALEALRLKGLEDKHPHQLSGGQKQRLAIAAALAIRPTLLVLDEPTSQLDPVGSQEVFEVTRRLNQDHGITVVMVSHASEELAEYADRILLLSRGELQADKPPGDFFQDIDFLLEHGVRPPAVTAAFSTAVRGSNAPGRYPVTLSEALEQRWSVQSGPRPHSTFATPGDAPVHSNETVIRTRDLQFSYEDGTEALRGLSVDIKQGDYIAIVGQNGAGKSTLIRHFVGLLTPSTGAVQVFDRYTQDYEVSEIAQRVGYVSQNPDNQIFTDSVRTEVSYALLKLGVAKDEVAARVDQSLEQLDLGDVADRHPVTLSKADRSRVVIAAILAMRPEVLIFDEPTTGQDYQGSKAILELTRELWESGKTIIVVTHHLYLLPGYAERLLIMGRGRLLSDSSLRSGLYATATLEETYLNPPQLVRFVEGLGDEALQRSQPLTPDELALTMVAG